MNIDLILFSERSMKLLCCVSYCFIAVLGISSYSKEVKLRGISLIDQISTMSEEAAARSQLIEDMTKALDARLADADVQKYLPKKTIEQSRERWVKEFEESETLHYTAQQNSSAYLPFLLRSLPLMDISSDDLHFENVLDNALWAFHVRGLYPWAMNLSEQIFMEFVTPYAVADEPRRGNWRYELQWLLDRTVLSTLPLSEMTTPEAIQKLALEINRKLWSLFEGGEIVFSPDLAPEIIAPKDVIEKKKASCTGLSLLLIYAYRSIGIPARLAGVFSWNNQKAESDTAVIARRQLLEGQQPTPVLPPLNNHSWVEIYDGEHWAFTGAHEAPTEGPSFNNTFFYPSKTDLQIAGDPIFAIFVSSYSNREKTFPLAWNPTYFGVYGEDVTNCYQKGYPIGPNPQC